MQSQQLREMEPFYEKLEKYYDQKPMKKPFTKEQINTMVEEILTAKLKHTTKTRRQYFLLNTYDVIQTADGQTKSLVKKNKSESANFVYIVSYEEIYKKLLEIHIATGHGSRDKMSYALANKYQIPRPCIEIFLSFCETCHKKKSKMPSKIIVTPVINSDFMNRGEVDLIDFRSLPDGDFKWLLSYQDHATKFLCLRPLKTQTAIEVATELLKIFLTFGAPQVLQSNNGREFCHTVIQEVKSLWPQLHLVNGRPRHSQSPSSIEKSNQDVEAMLRAWMIDNKNTAWALGCNFVQWQKNCSPQKVIGGMPYEAVFGELPKVGLESTHLPTHIIPSLTTEEDLEQALSAIKPDNIIENTTETSSSNSYAEVTATRIECPGYDFKNYNKTIIVAGEESMESMELPAVAESSKVSEDLSQYNRFVNSIHNNSNIGLTNTDTVVCVVCSKEISGAHQCANCNMAVHALCGESIKSEEGFGEVVTCKLCSTEQIIELNKKESLIGLKRAGENITTDTKKRLPDVQIGDCVLVAMDK